MSSKVLSLTSGVIQEVVVVSTSDITDAITAHKGESDPHPTKQDLLVSGVNIKTVNNESLLGVGDIVITGASTNLTTSQDSVSVTINSDPGAGATIPTASQTLAGVMSASQVQKLDGISAGAEVNQNAFSNIAVSGQNTVAADSKTDTLTLVAGSNIAIVTAAATDSITISNTSPDQVVSITGGGATTVSGTYPNFTISSTNTTYNTATSTVAGLVEIFSDTVQSVGANAISTASNRTYGTQLNAAGQVVVNVPWTDTVYNHPTSGVAAGTYKSVTVDQQGHVTAGTNPTTLAGYGITDAASNTHNHTLDSLSNVVIAANSDNEVLAWDSAASKWINQTATEAGLQPALVSGTNIKTINGTSVLGSGNITTPTTTVNNTLTSTSTTEALSAAQGKVLQDSKQANLVSGTNIKTISGQSLLGSGNIDIVTYTLEWSQTTFYVTQQATAKITNFDSYTNYNVTALLGTVSIAGDTITYTAPSVAGNEVVSINGIPVASFEVTPLQYGVDWNPTTDIYTRTGAAVGTANSTSYAGSIQTQMKRCVLNANGTVAYYLHPTNSTLKADGTAATIDGSAGNVMVEIPKFYHKYENVGGVHKYSISPIAEAGYTLHPAFIRGDVEKNFRYYPAYEGWYDGKLISGKLISGSGRVPTVNQTRAKLRGYAAANGTGWSLIDWNLLYAVQLLFLTEYATFDTQAMLGNGNDTGTDYTRTTGGSNGIGNGSSPATNDDTWMSYRGIENWYASMFKFIDGVNVQDMVYFVNNKPATFADDVFTGDYVSTGVTSATSNGYISNMSSSNKGFIPSEVAGSDSTKVPDYFAQSTGNGVVLFGGTAGNGLAAGGFFLAANLAADTAAAFLGSGVSY